MGLPKTLLALAGADLTPSSLSSSILVIVDAQQEYVDGALILTGVDEALMEIAKLIERARKNGTPIIHIAHKGQKGGVFDREEGGKGAFAALAAPKDDEVIIEKSLPNGFSGTNLSEEIEGIGRKELIICGFMTHMCVNSTARAALDHGYRTTIVSKACATRDLPNLEGGIIGAAQLHDASLIGLTDRYSIVVSSSDEISI
ncbi:MAG: cysteine hydrolase family protein [Sneathiella sp.]